MRQTLDGRGKKIFKMSGSNISINSHTAAYCTSDALWAAAPYLTHQYLINERTEYDKSESNWYTQRRYVQ